MIVLAVVAVLLAAILLAPIRVFAVYRGSLSVWVKVLFLRYDVLPKRKKLEKAEKPLENPPENPPEPPKKEPVKPPEPPKPRPEKMKPEKEPPRQKKDLSEPPKTEPSPEVKDVEETTGFVDKFLHYYEMANELFGPFKRALRRLLKLRLLKADVWVGVQDAADTAVYTGMLWAVAGNLLGLLTQFVTVERPEINIAPAYNQTVLKAEGECIIRTNPANIIGAAAIAALGWLRYKKQIRRNKK